jgi:AcrR family transcriptional regulator
MPKAFTEQEKKRISERLLKEGQRQFAAHGLRKTSVEELAAAAGISKGAFYLFYESKEALFMDVMEEAERRFRVEVLAVIDRPGPSPRARLLRVFQTAFSVWKTMPILRWFTTGDYELLYRGFPPDKLKAHLQADQEFIDELIARCRDAGIPITAPAEQITGLMYAIVFSSMHEGDLGPEGFPGGGLDLLLELVSAFCLGEVVIQS